MQNSFRTCCLEMYKLTFIWRSALGVQIMLEVELIEGDSSLYQGLTSRNGCANLDADIN